MSSADSSDRRKTAQRWLVTLIQMAITAGVLYLLLHDPAKRAKFAQELRNADRLWLLLGVACYGAVELLAAWRWELLLHVQGIFLSRARLLMLLLVGVFFNFFIPGGTGGDVVKVFYLFKEAPGKGPAAVLSVIIDRIVGLFSLIVLAAVFIVARWTWLTSTDQTRSCVYTALVILAISGGFVVFASFLSGFGLVHRLPARFPARSKLAELALALNQYGRARLRLSKAFAISLLCHLGYIFVFYCGARSLEEAGRQLPTFVDMCTVMPVVNTITALPISLGGLGVREGLFQIFLNQLAGVEEETALATSSIGFLLTAMWGGVGGLLYLFYRPSEHAKVTHITEEVAAVEQAVVEAEIALETGVEEKPCPVDLTNVR